jgi:hypothetical protein
VRDAGALGDRVIEVRGGGRTVSALSRCRRSPSVPPPSAVLKALFKKS